MTPRPHVLRFATSNPGKLSEARTLLPIPVEPVDVDLDEIQAPTIERITIRKLETVRQVTDGPVFVEDVALGFEDLGGFPGPYVKWLLEAAGGEGLARIAKGLGRALARATCHVAYWDGECVRSFVGECEGRVVTEARGDRGFGWDAWFEPVGHRVTFAEMAPGEKSRCSHRSRAYEKFAAFLLLGA